VLDILFLTHRLPFPPDRGDRIRSFEMIRYLAQRHRIALGAVVDDAPAPAHLAALRELCTSIDVGRRGGIVRALMLPAHLLTAVPLTVPAFASRKLRQAVADRVERHRFDVVFIYCSAMAPYALAHGAAPKVIDFIDADSEKWLDYARRTRSPMRAVYWREGTALRRYERRVARACAHAFTASERETQILAPLAPDTPFTTIPNGVHVEERARPSGTANIVFTGVMDYWPNVDAMEHFVRDIFPLVRRRVPRATLTIVGQRPIRQVRRLAEHPGVVVTGPVPEIRPYLEQAAVFVAPLRIARGVQNKVLEAMASGVPVVCTHAALAGLSAVAGTDLLAADAPDDFASCTANLLEHPDKAAQVGRAGAEYVRRYHQWDTHLARLEGTLLDVAEHRSSQGIARG
jgi:sugar transferase (PEP-CTERM/EpsH1 system associated)